MIEGVLEHTPQISCHLTIWCVLEYMYIPRELSLKKLL